MWDGSDGAKNSPGKEGTVQQYRQHPSFPRLPASVPLTYTLTTKACLSEQPADRPSFEQLLAILDDLQAEVATGTYLNSRGNVQVRCLSPLTTHRHAAACRMPTAGPSVCAP